jgi:hypothetical protein
MEPLSSYQQFLIVGFHGYESCTRCLATATLEHIFPKTFRPFGHNSTFLPAYTLPYTYTIKQNWEMKLYHSRKDSYADTYIHFYIYKWVPRAVNKGVYNKIKYETNNIFKL